MWAEVLKLAEVIMKKYYRILVYALGCIVLAFGITLNTKAGLGVSPIISLPFSISQISGINFSVLTFAEYTIFVVIQYLIDKESRSIKLLFQVPFSFAFSLLLELYGRVISTVPDVLWIRIVALCAAVVITGIGIWMTVSMDFIPNPADGLARSVGKAIKKDMGMGKNTIDLISVICTLSVGLIFAHKVIGIGLGTVVAVIFTGISVKVFNSICGEKIRKVTGMSK